MYKNQLFTKKSKTGIGVFTKVTIPANSPILEFSGDFYAKENLIHTPAQYLQIGKNLYLGPSGDIDDYVNHSCNPNSVLHIVGRRATLYSLYVIPINSEITFDYSTSSTDTASDWQMECKCGSFNCRKVISGFGELNKDIQKEYTVRGLIPLFLTHSIFIKK